VRHSQTRWIRVVLFSAVLLAVAAIAFHLAHTGDVARANSSSPAARPTSVSLPLYFEPNQGQTNPQVKFLAHGAGYGLFLTTDEAVLDLERPATNDRPAAGSVIRMHLEGASAAASIQGSGQLPGKSSYFIGNDPAKWHRDIPQFARVEYQNVYPGINLVYYGKQRQLEYDFQVAPGADPGRITLCFQGASARLESGDLILSTANGDVRFQAPHIYQVSAGHETSIPGGFRLQADNKVGFAIGSYDRTRELVIDPVLSYSTYLGGSGTESLVKLAVGQDFNMYVAGSTNSTDFPGTSGGIQPNLGGAGATNVFIAKMNTAGQLLYATYLGGSGTDNLAGVGVDNIYNIYVAGTTTSTNFPTTSNAFQTSATFSGSQTHGFLSMLSFSGSTYSLGYSTYLAGTTGSDIVTGLAVDPTNQNAFVTGTTTSIDVATGFPSTPTAFQPCPFEPVQAGGSCPITSGPPQFFASEIHTTNFSGPPSMAYSTYLGGSNGTTSTGGGIAVDLSDNMYFTGTTDMQSISGVNNSTPFPTFNAYQPCLNQPGVTTCAATGTGITDAILVKLNPNLPNSNPYFATYVGGSQNDAGNAVALDSSGNAYVTGSTNSTDWACSAPCFFGPQSAYVGSSGNANAFVAKIDNETLTNTIFPLTFFSYIGGTGPDIGQAVAIDSNQNAYVTGLTSGGLITANPIENKAGTAIGGTYNGGGDAFVALLSTTIPSSSTTPFPPGDYISYLGGSALDEGTGIALDINGNAYVAGTTVSAGVFPLGFPVTSNAYQPSLNGSLPDAFVSEIGALSSNQSTISVTAASSSPSPNPVDAGTPVAFIFNLTNTGPDPATNVTFQGVIPNTPLATTAKAIASSGSCNTVVGSQVTCTIPSLAPTGTATVEIDLTPAVPVINPPLLVSVSGAASANGGPLGLPFFTQPNASVVDYTLSCNGPFTVAPGGLAIFTLTLTPLPSYNGTITMGQTTAPAIVTASTPTFTIPSIVLSGNTQQTTQLDIQTVPQPVTTGSLFQRGRYYATWLPLAGLSLLGLGIGVGGRGKNRHWFIGALLGMVVLLILLPACSSNSSTVTPNQGTASGVYTVTVTGGAGTAAAHQAICTLNVT
jgi:uncharacterized repeat protein (TIGR01451 family)